MNKFMKSAAAIDIWEPPIIIAIVLITSVTITIKRFMRPEPIDAWEGVQGGQEVECAQVVITIIERTMIIFLEMIIIPLTIIVIDATNIIICVDRRRLGGKIL